MKSGVGFRFILMLFVTAIRDKIKKSLDRG